MTSLATVNLIQSMKSMRSYKMLFFHSLILLSSYTFSIFDHPLHYLTDLFLTHSIFNVILSLEQYLISSKLFIFYRLFTTISLISSLNCILRTIALFTIHLWGSIALFYLLTIYLCPSRTFAPSFSYSSLSHTTSLSLLNSQTLSLTQISSLSFADVWDCRQTRSPCHWPCHPLIRTQELLLFHTEESGWVIPRQIKDDTCVLTPWGGRSEGFEASRI